MKKIIIIVVVLLLLIGGGAAAYFLLAKDDAPAGEAGDAAEEVVAVEEEKEPIYFALRPEFVTNYQVQGSTRYLQLSMQVMAHEQDVIDKVELNMPAVRNQLIMLLSAQDFEQLASQEGKETLRSDVRAAINEAVKFSEDEGVKEVFFTAFVMQ